MLPASSMARTQACTLGVLGAMLRRRLVAPGWALGRRHGSWSREPASVPAAFDVNYARWWLAEAIDEDRGTQALCLG